MHRQPQDSHVIKFCLAYCELAFMLVTVTKKGISSLDLDNDENALRLRLIKKFPNTRLVEFKPYENQ